MVAKAHRKKPHVLLTAELSLHLSCASPSPCPAPPCPYQDLTMSLTPSSGHSPQRSLLLPHLLRELSLLQSSRTWELGPGPEPKLCQRPADHPYLSLHPGSPGRIKPHPLSLGSPGHGETPVHVNHPYPISGSLFPLLLVVYQPHHARPAHFLLQAAGLALISEQGGSSEASQDQTHSPTNTEPKCGRLERPTPRSHPWRSHGLLTQLE